MPARPRRSPLPCALRPPHRAGGIRWSAIVFLIAFTILLAVVAAYCLRPGMQAALQAANDDEKRRLVAWYRLLLAVLLLILFSGLMLTLRVGRFFFPRPTPTPTRTEYVDAWAESARRVKVAPLDGGEDEDFPEEPD